MRCYTTRFDELLQTAPEVSRATADLRVATTSLPVRMMKGVIRAGLRVLNTLQSESAVSPATPAPLTKTAPTRESKIARQPVNNATPHRKKLRVVHVIGNLSAGGAERQLVYVARESQRRGTLEARILTINPTVGAGGHYLPLAEEGGVTVEQAGSRAGAESLAAFSDDIDLHALLEPLPLFYRAWVVELAGEFLRLRPNVVHAWLDHPNMWAGIAALATGVPNIVLSTRNVNPSHFPAFDYPEFLPWYRAFASSPRVQFIANSKVGALDYAAWIGINPNRFKVIMNGFDPSACVASSASEISSLRSEEGLNGKQVVLGVFRLADEKQPLVFVEAAKRVLVAIPNAVVLIAGDGPMRTEVESAIASQTDGRIRLLGRREDVSALLSIADVVLHTSRQEGSSNALIEAQSLGCPVVATRGGGTVDAVEDGESGYLCAVGDAASLAARVCELLRDDALRTRMSERARAFAQAKFGLARMVDETLALYAPAHAKP